MTTAKIATKLASNAIEALAAHVPGLYANPGKRVVAIVELAHVERCQPAPDEDKEASVTLGIKHMEVANTEQEDTVREALRALYTEIELSEDTLRACRGELTAIEAARLHVAVQKWSDFASSILHNDKLSASDLRREIRTLSDGLRATIHADVLVKG
jgi:hypothetical protein